MKRFFLFAAATVFAFSASAQTMIIKDTLSTVDKWSEDTKAGVYVMSGSKTVVSNAQATVTDAAAGEFSVKLHGIKDGQDCRMFIYSPYQEGKDIISKGKIKIQIPAVQNGGCLPLNFGYAAFKGEKNPKVECNAVARTSCFIIKLSSKCNLYEGWKLDRIDLVSEQGILAGDALVDITNGRIIPDKNGKGSATISYVPEKETFVGRDYRTIYLRAIPCDGLHGKKFRLDYTFSKDGKTQVLSHDVVGMDIIESYSYTLEERIPEVIAGRWHQAAFPGENWESVKPETMGYSTAKLDELRKLIKSEYTTTSMMVIVGGKVIFEMGDCEEPVRIASCRKSLMSMLYGKYVENGTINLESTLEELGIDDKGGLLPIEKQATIRNLLTARSGIFHKASNDGDDQKHAPARGSVKPGTFHLYNNWDFNAVGGIFEKLTGKDIYDAFQEDIAIPIGMQDYYIDNQHKTGITDPTQSVFLAYHFWLSTRDMARVGYLMLRNGNWNGTQVISEDWVKTTTAPFTKRADMNPASRHKKEFEYGYLWWTFCPEYKNYDPAVYAGGYTATGQGGQYITVLPALDMVIAHKDKTAKSQKSKYYKLIAKVAACRQQ